MDENDILDNIFLLSLAMCHIFAPNNASNMQACTVYAGMVYFWKILKILDIFDTFYFFLVYIGYFRYFHFTALDWVMSVERFVFKLCISEWGY